MQSETVHNHHLRIDSLVEWIAGVVTGSLALGLGTTVLHFVACIFAGMLSAVGTKLVNQFWPRKKG
jgi:hypothetical protein